MNDFHFLSGEKFITFVDFVQALAIRDIRRQHNVSLQKIREALNRAKEEYHITHPFAMNHRTFLLEKDIHITLHNDDDLTQLTCKKPGQMTMRPIIEVYLQDLTFSEDGLAVNYKSS